jgi:outer membrane protein assembly factor BamA
MRYQLAQVVILAASCLLAGRPHVDAQSCPTPHTSDDERPPGPEISIAQLTFSGFLQLPISDQDQIAESIKEVSYGDSLDATTDEALERVRMGWQNHGYFKVLVNGNATTLDSTSAGRRIALSVHVDEGSQYRLGGIGFKHNRAVSNLDALRRLFPIRDGETFSREKVAEGLENLRKAYGELGYINFTSIPDTRFDDEKKLIYLDIDMDEGKPFYVSSVDVLGLDEPTRQELLRDLPIKVGQPYNSRLWELSLLKHRSMFPDCGGCRAYQPLRLDERAGAVAVTLDFRPCSGD